MTNELKGYLRENERICWHGKPEAFELLEHGVKFQILRKWILTVALTAGLLVSYCSANETWNYNLIALVLLVAVILIISPFTEARSTRATQYWITDQRVILMTRDKSFYYMPLECIDDYRIVDDVAEEKCLVLGSELFCEIHKQLRWRTCHPKLDIHAHQNQDQAMGMVLYGIKDAEAVADLLEKGRPSRAA